MEPKGHEIQAVQFVCDHFYANLKCIQDKLNAMLPDITVGHA